MRMSFILQTSNNDFELRFHEDAHFVDAPTQEMDMLGGAKAPYETLADEVSATHHFESAI